MHHISKKGNAKNFEQESCIQIFSNKTIAYHNHNHIDKKVTSKFHTSMGPQCCCQNSGKHGNSGTKHLQTCFLHIISSMYRLGCKHEIGFKYWKYSLFCRMFLNHFHGPQFSLFQTLMRSYTVSNMRSCLCTFCHAIESEPLKSFLFMKLISMAVEF